MENPTIEEKRIAADILIAALQSNFLFTPSSDNAEASKQLSMVYLAVLSAVVTGDQQTH